MDIKKLAIILIAFSLSNCDNSSADPNTNEELPKKEISNINYSVVNMYPHDVHSFTEGLLVHENKLYESTGSPNDLPETRSVFGELDLKTGKITAKVELDRNKYFGEGIVFFNDKAYQLTYQSKIGFVYNLKTFSKIDEFNLPTQEGWGLTTDNVNLVMSDGTSNLYYIDPNTYKLVNKLLVMDENGPVKLLNELEFIRGFIYANLYGTNLIVKIDPGSGNVIARMDLSSIAYEVKIRHAGSLEMNGIAYNDKADKVYITGKMWPSVYEIDFPK
jgi:glutaminyl-peptide cyclotransferase